MLKLPERARQRAVRLAALAERLVPQGRVWCDRTGLMVVRLTESRNGLEAVLVFTTSLHAVLCVDGCGVVLQYRPGPWCRVLEGLAAGLPSRAQDVTLTTLATEDTVQVALDYAATLLAEPEEDGENGDWRMET